MLVLVCWARQREVSDNLSNTPRTSMSHRIRRRPSRANAANHGAGGGAVNDSTKNLRHHRDRTMFCFFEAADRLRLEKKGWVPTFELEWALQIALNEIELLRHAQSLLCIPCRALQTTAPG